MKKIPVPVKLLANKSLSCFGMLDFILFFNSVDKFHRNITHKFFMLTFSVP